MEFNSSTHDYSSIDKVVPTLYRTTSLSQDAVDMGKSTFKNYSRKNSRSNLNVSGREDNLEGKANLNYVVFLTEFEL